MAAGLWACAIGSLTVGKIGIGIYLVIICIPISIWELGWLINRCQSVFNQNSQCCVCWRWFHWIELWKRSLTYILLSIPCYVIVVGFATGIVAGLMLDFCALLNFIKTFQYKKASLYLAHDPAVDRPIQDAVNA